MQFLTIKHIFNLMSLLKIKLLMIVCYYQVMYEFESEFTFYSLPECQGTLCSKQAPYLKFK